VFADTPYVLGWWYWNPALGDNVSTSGAGTLSQQLPGLGWQFIGTDAAYLVNQLPGTTSAVTYFSSARGDYDTAVLAVDKNAATGAGYSAVATEGYLFNANYSATDAVPFTLYWSDARQDNFLTYAGGSAATSSGYLTVDTQGYGLRTN